MKTHIIRADGDSHFTVCGLDRRKVNAERAIPMTPRNATCKRCNGQAQFEALLARGRNT